MSSTIATGGRPPLPGPVVFFDGVCGLCNWSVDFILRRDTGRRLWFAPLQGETAAERLGMAPGDDYSTMVLLDGDDRLERSDAVVRILGKIGGVWGAAGWLLWVIPRPLRNLGYRMVASNRYSLFGKKAACRLPTPEERSRFLP
jgi:predicted DCC family thiol-disulfide oxidoreductase YuxK